MVEGNGDRSVPGLALVTRADRAVQPALDYLIFPGKRVIAVFLIVQVRV